METVTFKLQEEIAKKIDNLINPLHYNNRTEFIREAIREKINKIENDNVMRSLEKFKGAAKTKVSDEMLHEAGEIAVKKIAKKFKVKLD